MSNSEKSALLYYSDDMGLNFKKTEIQSDLPMVSPRIFFRTGDEFFIFVTLVDKYIYEETIEDESGQSSVVTSEEDTLNIYYKLLYISCINRTTNIGFSEAVI